MKGKLDENVQYEHNSNQFPTQPLVHLKNICSTDNDVFYFQTYKCSFHSNDYDLREEWHVNAISNLWKM